MKLKFYLRGLGIGIVVTALLMGLATKNQGTMTDEEIKERAAVLGMVEQKVLSDISTPAPGDDAEVEPTIVPEITAEPVPTMTPTAAPTAVPTIAPTEEPTESTDQSETITFEIKSGETSWSISKALYEAGVVENASDFDNFLCQNGYDKTIRTGTFEIPVSASYQEIAEKIAR